MLFFDTNSTNFELDTADDLVWRDRHWKVVNAADEAAVKRAGFRTHGKSKDSRDDLPQVVVAVAVTRTDVPSAGVVLAGQHRRFHAALAHRP